MKNYGVEIEYNGEKLIRAGFEDRYFVLSCIFSLLRRKRDESEEYSLSVGGLNIETDQSVDWLRQELKLGDKISVEVIDGDFNKPTKVKEAMSKEELLKQKIDYYYRLKEELKGHIEE